MLQTSGGNVDDHAGPFTGLALDGQCPAGVTHQLAEQLEPEVAVGRRRRRVEALSVVADPQARAARCRLDGHRHVLGVTHPEAVQFAAHDLEIRGRAHHGYDDMAPVAAAQPRRTRWQVVMAHGHYVAPEDWTAEAHRSWRISDAALAASGADYVALGHWDRAAPVGDGRVPAYYSGSPHLAGTVNVIRLSEAAGVAVTREPLRR